jgi:hypothetical protein
MKKNMPKLGGFRSFAAERAIAGFRDDASASNAKRAILLGNCL